jgi:hypothetical protein
MRAGKGVIDRPLGTRPIAGRAIMADHPADVHDRTVAKSHMHAVQTPFSDAPGWSGKMFTH